MTAPSSFIDSPLTRIPSPITRPSLMGRVAGLVGIILSAAPVHAAMIDTLGDTSNTANGTGIIKSNAYAVEIDTRLLGFEVLLDFVDTQTLQFGVYTRDTEFGTFTQLDLRSHVVEGEGAAFYASGPLDIPLETGRHYLFAFAWSGNADYFFEEVPDTQPTAFGQFTHALATGLYPLGPALTSLVDDRAVFHQRVTTANPIPEPGTGLLLALVVLTKHTLSRRH